MDHAITIRPAGTADRGALARLAQLDSADVPAGEALLGFVDGELRAALPLDGGRPIADPFAPTLAVLELLSFQAEHRLAAARSHGPWSLQAAGVEARA